MVKARLQLRRAAPFSACVAAVLLVLCQPGTLAAQGLVGSWPFNGDANDESGNGNHGTVTGATLTTDRHGNANSAYRFDGVDDVINFGNDTSLQAPDVTAMCWIKSERDDAPWAPTVLVKSTKGVDGYVILDGGQNLFAEPNRDFGWQAFGITTHTVGQWHHLAFTYDSSTQEACFYKDGGLVGQLSFPMDPPVSSDLMIGYGYNTRTPNRIDGFQGSIDDVRIYNRALTGLEVAAMLVPEIGVEQPVGSDLVSGVATVDFGTEAVGYEVVRTVTVRNAGDGLLTGLAVSVTGADPAVFPVVPLGVTTLAAGQVTTFEVRFIPVLGGATSAGLQIASNDADENPFVVNLTGVGLHPANDADGDGMNDAAELKLAALGFDWQVDSSGLVTALETHGHLHGLYTESQLVDLRPGSFLVDVSGGTVTLDLQLQKSDDLVQWVDIGSPVQWSEPGDGKAFFRFVANPAE